MPQYTDISGCYPVYHASSDSDGYSGEISASGGVERSDQWPSLGETR